MGRKSDRDTFMKFLAIIGAILVIIVAIIHFIGFPNLVSIAYGLIWFVIGLIILMSCFKPDNPIPFNEAFILIMGIIVLVLGFVMGFNIIAIIAGIIIIIGGFIGMLT
ncbi:MAG: hypothetical protein ACFE8A_08765 [Candidatus Hodarchaeota archaeon]